MQLPVVLLGSWALLCVYVHNSDSAVTDGADSRKLTESTTDHGKYQKLRKYDSTYPLTKATKVDDYIIFKIGLISDMDGIPRNTTESKTPISYYLQGTLKWKPSTQTITIELDKHYKTLESNISHNGRGMELSDLVTFDGMLLSICDRTGFLYVINDDGASPWIRLMDGKGKTAKGFKGEWALVKDEHLYVGSLGKEWTTTTGVFVNTNPLFVRRISPTGDVENLDWSGNYKALRARMGIDYPGYMIHESGDWSKIHKKWFFLPRRASKEIYNDKADESRGTNLILIADEDFKNIEVKTVGEIIPTRGFSAFKFIPGTDDKVIVALKTVEHLETVSSYISAFTVEGKILYGETKVDDIKYEGLEFI